MNLNYLDFESPIVDLEQKIEELRFTTAGSEVNLTDEITRLQAKSRELTQQIFSNLSAWQVAQLARHPLRPYAQDYINSMFTDFEELHGDRHFRDDPSIIGGIARLEGKPVVVIGQQKGRDAKERVLRNFGMPMPEGYRKALRLMQLAERFNMPVLTFIDTPGAFPGISAEERNQSEAIARNLFELAKLRTPVIATIIGEGGSGGALAIGVADHVMMLQYSIYSVISPEGCASILFKSASRAQEAAEAMRLTAPNLAELKLIDEVIPEPLGGAHRDSALTIERVKERVMTALDKAQSVSVASLLNTRYDRLMAYGAHETQH